MEIPILYQIHWHQLLNRAQLLLHQGSLNSCQNLQNGSVVVSRHQNHLQLVILSQGLVFQVQENTKYLTRPTHGQFLIITLEEEREVQVGMWLSTFFFFQPDLIFFSLALSLICPYGHRVLQSYQGVMALALLPVQPQRDLPALGT